MSTSPLFAGLAREAREAVERRAALRHYAAGDSLFAQGDGAVNVSLQSGDIVLLLTDGLEEAMAPDESFFGIERTLNVVRQNREKPAREVLDALYRAVRDFSQQTPQLDDVTAIVIKVV